MQRACSDHLGGARDGGDHHPHPGTGRARLAAHTIGHGPGWLNQASASAPHGYAARHIVIGSNNFRSPSRFLSSRRVGNRRMRSEAPDLCASCSPSWRCACAVRPCRTSSCLRLNRPLVPYRVGGGFIGASLDHAGQPLVPADGGDVARVCSSRSMHEPALPELVEYARGGAGREADRWCGWPTRSGSAREAQSRVAADGAVRRGARSLLGARIVFAVAGGSERWSGWFCSRELTSVVGELSGDRYIGPMMRL